MPLLVPELIPLVLFKESAPLETSLGAYFSFPISILKRLTPVLPSSSILLLCFSNGFTESKPVKVIELLPGRFTFLLELGLALMSGKKDSVDFCMMSVDFYITDYTFSFFARNLLRSNPPPVISSLRAFLYYSA